MKPHNTINTPPTVEEYRHLIGAVNKESITQRDIDVSNYFFLICLRNDNDKIFSSNQQAKRKNISWTLN